MKLNTEGGIDLDEAEVVALARIMASRVIANAVEFDYALWEDVPRLSERSWAAVADYFEVIAGTLRVSADVRLPSDDGELVIVDAAYVLGAVS